MTARSPLAHRLGDALKFITIWSVLRSAHWKAGLTDNLAVGLRKPHGIPKEDNRQSREERGKSTPVSVVNRFFNARRLSPGQNYERARVYVQLLHNPLFLSI